MSDHGFKAKIRSWISAGRFVFFPWILLNSLFGAVLGSFYLLDWFLSFLVSFSMLTMGHYINDWRDFVNGIDKKKEGSLNKPYTDAPQILPRGLLSLRTVKISALLFGLIGIIILLVSFEFRIDSFLFFVIGTLTALTYTDIAKPLGIGEVYLFLGHGFSTVCFTYSILNGIDLVAILGGSLLGFWAATAYTIDQWKDIKADYNNGISTFAHKLSKNGVEVSQWWGFVVIGSLLIQSVLILTKVLPIITCITFLTIPLAWFIKNKLTEDFDEGLLLVVVCMWSYTALLVAGTILDGWLI